MREPPVRPSVLSALIPALCVGGSLRRSAGALEYSCAFLLLSCRGQAVSFNRSRRAWLLLGVLGLVGGWPGHADPVSSPLASASLCEKDDCHCPS